MSLSNELCSVGTKIRKKTKNIKWSQPKLCIITWREHSIDITEVELIGKEGSLN